MNPPLRGIEVNLMEYSDEEYPVDDTIPEDLETFLVSSSDEGSSDESEEYSYTSPTEDLSSSTDVSEEEHASEPSYGNTESIPVVSSRLLPYMELVKRKRVEREQKLPLLLKEIEEYAKNQDIGELLRCYNEIKEMMSFSELYSFHKCIIHK